MLHFFFQFMHRANLEMRSVSIDDRVYEASERTLGRLIVLAGLEEERVEYWDTRAAM